MQSKLCGAWLLSTSVGVLGLISYGGYTRLKKAGLSMVEWKPLSISFPSTDAEWEKEYTQYKQFPEYMQNEISLEDFKSIYKIEYNHRLYARGMGLYLVLPMSVFWYKGLIPQALKPRLLGITCFFGLQGALGWIMVRSGLQHKEYDGRVKVEPINLASHLICGVGLYSLIFSTALTCLRGAPERFIKTSADYFAMARGRKLYMGLLHLSLATVFSGALVAGSDAGKIMTNWPWYGDNYFYPSQSFSQSPFYVNFIQDRESIQFVHRNLAYLTYFWSGAVLRYFIKSEHKLPGTTNAYITFGFASLQVLLGIHALYGGSGFEESLMHQGNGLLYLTSILYGLNTLRKPNKAFIAKILGK
jgi:cytochrome c oxidase assembly protein subunit 15